VTVFQKKVRKRRQIWQGERKKKVVFSLEECKYVYELYKELKENPRIQEQMKMMYNE
jgi:thioredoxin-related protein